MKQIPRTGSENNKNQTAKHSVQVVFDVEKALKAHMPTIEINEITTEKDIDQTKEFRKFLFYFNEAFESKLNTDDIMFSRTNFRSFYDFIMFHIINGNIIIKKEIAPEFMKGMKKLQDKYNQNIRSLEKYHDEIVKTIYYPQGMTKKHREVINKMNLFDQAYSLMKIAFEKHKRKGIGKEKGERYFEHLKRTMEIVLRELPNPNLNKILIALLHDVVEDIPRYDIRLIETIYGKYIANGVKELTKKSRKLYLTNQEKEEYKKHIHTKKRFITTIKNKIQKTYEEEIMKVIGNKAEKLTDEQVERFLTPEEEITYKNIQNRLAYFEKTGKERRNEDYFGHLEQLNDDYLDVKFADRIDNLRDMDHLTKTEIEKKIQETEKYFIHVAEKRNPTAHRLLTEALENLKKLLTTK